MGVVPRKFFCGDCKKDRWPGDCAHPRTVTTARFPYVVGLTDLCQTCAKGKKECKCPEKARQQRHQATVDATIEHVFALTGCRCSHHVTAYIADKVKEAIACGTCCREWNLALPRSVPSLSGDVVGNGGRGLIALHKVEAAIAFGLEGDPDRELLLDKQMPGWVTNGHFIAHVGAAAEALHAKHRVRSIDSMYDEFKKWEAGGPGAQLFFGKVKCAPESAPVDMVAWGVGYEWSAREPNDTLSIVAPAYSAVLTMNGARFSVHRAQGQDTNGFSMLIAWDTDAKKIIGAAMPRRETVIR